MNHHAVFFCVEHYRVPHSEQLVHECIIVPADLSGRGLWQAIKLDDGAASLEEGTLPVIEGVGGKAFDECSTWNTTVKESVITLIHL